MESSLIYLNSPVTLINKLIEDSQVLLNIPVLFILREIIVYFPT